jgi:DNA polymerase (family 10)
MSTNQAVADSLAEIAKLMELLGENKFKAIAHDKAARIVESYSTDMAALVGKKGEEKEAHKRLIEIDGIGPRIADKIIEFIHHGRMTELNELRARVPKGLLPLLQIPGLGPKTLQTLWKEGGVTDLASLKKCIDSGVAATLPRMGEKSVAKIKESLSLAEQAGIRLPLGLAMPIAEGIIESLRKVKGIKRIAFAGSLRRGKDTIGDIDILVSTSDPAAAHEAFKNLPGVVQVLSSGETRASVRVAVGRDGGRWGELKDDMAGPSIQVDLKIIPEESWGAALYYFTGSKDHNVAVRGRTQEKGWTLNEYGLYEDDGKPAPHTRGLKPIASRTEEDIFKAMGLPFIPPEIRENRGEMRLTATPRLIELGDIKAELHAHTTASDGVMSIEELAKNAKKRGFHTIAVTDHSKSSAIANGLSAERLREHIKAVHAANRKIDGITILAGSEVDILADGRLDYDDDLLAELDIVVASPHASLSQDAATATKRLIRAIENPHVRILGHPTGRLINRRAGLSPDMAEIIAAARQHNVALEINAHWLRLDLRDTHVHMAVEAGCLIAIDCDVHVPEDFDCLRYGVLTGRRGWLTADLCVNTWDERRLGRWLKARKGHG